MSPLAKALRLWRTVRHLKPVQVYGRVWFRLARPTPDLRPAPGVRAPGGVWSEPARREPSLVGPTRMRFLAEARDLDAHGWDDPALEKLWRYNQHYFDDLVALGADARSDWHRALLARWIAECPPGRGTAWEPYPASLRLVNWIKWLRAGNEPVPGMLDSMAAQARFLARRLEWHLLGNHLFVNAKALVLVGLYFEGSEADRWTAKGWRILREQIPEQIHADGGQFERSPMYHALALEDFLDLANALRVAPGVCRAKDVSLVHDRVGPMRRFLAAVCHPDGGVASFNDSAQGIAPARAELEGYARRLGFPEPASDPRAAVHFPDTGFVRIERHGLVAILETGGIGPRYLPGHAHAETLSFELSLAGRRILVNSGTSRYGIGAERLRERGTAAHNTVVLASRDSSEVWGGFRVGRRATATVPEISERPDLISVAGSHDGYRKQGVGSDHARQWQFEVSGEHGRLIVRDRIEPWTVAESHWHFAPDVELEIASGGRELRAAVPGLRLRIAAEGAAWRVTRSKYSPRFGVSVANAKAVARFLGPAPTVTIEWSPCTSSSSPTTSLPR